MCQTQRKRKKMPKKKLMKMSLSGFKNSAKGRKIMKIFYLKRVEDESGVSGTGRIAQGFIFDNGKVALTWLSEHPSVTVYDSIGEVHAIHGHGGKTEVIMEPDYKRAYNEMKSFVDNFKLEDVMKLNQQYVALKKRFMKFQESREYEILKELDLVDSDDKLYA